MEKSSRRACALGDSLASMPRRRLGCRPTPGDKAEVASKRNPAEAEPAGTGLGWLVCYAA